MFPSLISLISKVEALNNDLTLALATLVITSSDQTSKTNLPRHSNRVPDDEEVILSCHLDLNISNIFNESRVDYTITKQSWENPNHIGNELTTSFQLIPSQIGQGSEKSKEDNNNQTSIPSTGRWKVQNYILGKDNHTNKERTEGFLGALDEATGTRQSWKRDASKRLGDKRQAPEKSKEDDLKGVEQSSHETTISSRKTFQLQNSSSIKNERIQKSRSEAFHDKATGKKQRDPRSG